MFVTDKKDNTKPINVGISYSSKSFNNIVNNAVKAITPEHGFFNKEVAKLLVNIIFSNCLSDSKQSFTIQKTNGLIIQGKHYTNQSISFILRRLHEYGYIEYTRGMFMPESNFYKPSLVSPTERLMSLVERNCKGIKLRKDSIPRIIIRKPSIDLSKKSIKNKIEEMEDDILEIEEKLSRNVIESRGSVISLSPIKRIFTENLDRHGRIYSTITSMRKTHRSRLLIDGESVCELDLTSSTLMIALSKLGKTLPKDFYTYYNDRGVAKTIAMVCLYANNERSAILACASRIKSKHNKIVIDLKSTFLACKARFSDLGVSDMFCKGKGINYMRYESDFCVDLILTCLREGFPVLSVHDSFICKKSDLSKLRTMMDLVYKKHFGALPICQIK
jgi:hypothetical protein